MAPSRVSPPPDSPAGGLSKEQIASFQDDGYLILRGALSPETIEGLLAESRQLLHNFSLDDHPMTRFSTGEDAAHVGDDYFLTSGDKVRFFFEMDAFDSEGKLNRPKEQAINKIGHYLHALSPPFAELLSKPSKYSPSRISRDLGFRQPEVLQSMVICKQPSIGGAVNSHQDSTFLYTNPPSAMGFWYALEDATLENGCLSFCPGSHKWAPIENRLVRKKDNKGTEFMVNDGPRFPNEDHVEEKKPENWIAGEVKAGDLVLIHGNILHKSEKNLSSKSRFIYTFHCIEGDGPVYDEKNWLQPPEEGFTRI